MAAFYFSAVLVCLLILTSPAQAGSPEYVVSKDAYAETKAKLNAHIKEITSAPDFREGGTPLVFLHSPGTKVFGTVLVFHGFGQNAFANRIQAQSLFDRKFNVVSFNLAGHAFLPSRWSSTVIREQAGYSSLRRILSQDPVVTGLLATLSTFNNTQAQVAYALSVNTFFIPAILSALRKALPANELNSAERLIELVTPGRTVPGMEKDLNKSFRSGHQRFESDPLSKLQLVQGLPGPIHTIGYSLGTTAVVNLAAQSKVIAKSVILAPFFGGFTNQKVTDFFHTAIVLGTLDLLTVPFGPVMLPGRTYAGALGPPATLLNRDSVLMPMRRYTETFCIVAEDDMAVDVDASLRVCRGKLGGRTFVYPKSFGIDHQITPETGNKFSKAMMEQIASFFSAGEVDDSAFLVPN